MRGVLTRLNGETMDVYIRAGTIGITRRSNRWVRATQGMPQRANGEVCSVIDSGAGSVTILSSIEYVPST